MSTDRYSRLYVRLILVVGLVALAGLLIWKKHIPLGLDLSGGSELHYRIRTEDLSEQDKQTVTQDTIDVIRRRVDPEGRLELDIRPIPGQPRFYIQLPGMGPEESKRIEDLIRRAGKLRFCLVDTDTENRARARLGEPVPGRTPFIPAEYDNKGEVKRWRRATWSEVAALPATQENWFLVENTARVTGESLFNPNATQDDSGLPAVGFQFRGEGRGAFERLTEENRGRYLAIVLDQDLYSAPRIESRISGAGIIHGKFTQQEVRDLVTVLRAGSLPADIELEWNNTVGAQLGEDSIRAGITASVISLILVILFMGIYYLSSGILANIAVILALVLLLGSMAGLQAVLTLPGIAGLVLTLGMAVDANVLINERIREETERGKTLRLAVRSGYDRAFVTILDSNLTTLITGLILFMVGTGPVRGFATTLCLGIVVSMFTAIWVTRWILDLCIEAGIVKSLPMLQIFRKPNIPFSRMRYAAITGSFVCIVAGLAVFFGRGEEKLDTDLTGGFRAEMELQTGVPISEFRQRVARLFRNADVQSVWSTAEARAEAGDPKLFSIRIRKLSDPQRLDKMVEDISEALRARDLYQGISSLPENEWAFRVTLSHKATEADLRAILAAAGYRDTAIREIMPQNAPSAEYLVRLRASVLAEEKPDAKVADVIKALDPLIVSQSIRAKIGQVTEEETSFTDKDSTKPAYVPIQLTEASSTAAVREALIDEVLEGKRPDNLRVAGHGADQGAEKAREMAVWGPRDVLETISRSGKAELRIRSFDQPTSGEIQVSLSSPQPETAIRDRLGSTIMTDLVRAIIPLTAADEFAVAMDPLSEDKAMEKIKTELTREFEAELAAGPDTRSPEIAPSAPPSFIGAKESSPDVHYFKLTVPRPMQLQEVHAALTAAGYPAALLTEKDINTTEVARQNVSEADLRLTGIEAEVEAAKAQILKTFAEKQSNPFRSIETIGAVVAGEMKDKAILAIILSCAAIVFYLWFRFGEAKFGLAAVIALVHDVLFTAGAVGVADALSGTTIGNFLGFSDIKVNVTMIAAFLTLIGYSVNDTIVVFDRIRENMGGVRRRVDAALVDMSVNQTLSRTTLTGLTTIFALLVLYVIGGSVIHGFAFVMLFGVLVGTYSSVFIASPILIGWESGMSVIRKIFRILTFRFD